MGLPPSAVTLPPSVAVVDVIAVAVASCTVGAVLEPTTVKEKGSWSVVPCGAPSSKTELAKVPVCVGVPKITPLI
jgi:hypothetical protein